MSRYVGRRANKCAKGLPRSHGRTRGRLVEFLVFLLVAAATYSSAAHADRNFGVRYHTDDHGAIAIVGNMLLSCVQGAQNPPATCASTVPVSGTGATGANLNEIGRAHV